MEYKDIINLPYAIFLGYLKYAKVFELEKTEEGQKQLDMASFIYETEPEMDKLRTLNI